MYKWFNIVAIITIACILTYMISLRKNNSVESFLEFIHIPKNAGTTIENIANEKNIKWGRFKPEHIKYEDSNHKNICPYWHTPPKYFNDGSFYKKDETFCVFRDPLERMLSEYKYANPKTEHTPDHLNSWVQDQLVPLNYKYGGMDCHFLPQYEFIYDDDGNNICDNVLNFEYLSKEFNELLKKKNIDLQLGETRKDNETAKSVTILDFNDKTIKLIQSVYHQDFEMLKKYK